MKLYGVFLFVLLSSSLLIAQPKNIIIMISDGCGYNQVNAASLYLYGETGKHVFESFPVVYAMATHSADGVKYNPDSSWHSFDWVLKKPTDSAASSTAISCGVKTYNGHIATDTEGKSLETIMERSEEKAK